MACTAYSSSSRSWEVKSVDYYGQMGEVREFINGERDIIVVGERCVDGSIISRVAMALTVC
eukprot:9496258-Pyramimonas_sp.AAC.1